MSKAIPADQTHKHKLAEMIRDDHAGEYGAQQIYKGQLSILKDDAIAPTLQHMAEQEQEHLQAFEEAFVEVLMEFAGKR